MIHFCLLFFLFLIPTIAGHAYVAQNTVSEEWLRIEDEYFIVKYKEGYKSDAELILKYCRYARNVTMKVYPHKLDVKVSVYLCDYESWRDKPYVTRADYIKAKICLLTPSGQPAEYRSQCNNLWYQKNMVHEYVHIPTLRDLHYRSRYKKLRNGSQKE